MLFDDPFAAALPILTDQAVLSDARALIDGFGDDAGFEAAARADRSRDLGNAVHFARWRQIERLIVVLASDEAIGTVH
ncbi:hypothetical protein SAMN06297144_0468 [Sphingomonas guangdongensis]|uniref:Uncharacterized protein n=1 Tax=Sphingomonas guangdongensis TaxID=1141890 RepID=A0A285QBU4_9SPHN|nr:hypothetical protein [Sphingomonas guangdongensis]SOB79281.1 hypothetical protein SAMN06297144_0468 [Sphingomonas guangdongensis]